MTTKQKFRFVILLLLLINVLLWNTIVIAYLCNEIQPYVWHKQVAIYLWTLVIAIRAGDVTWACLDGLKLILRSRINEKEN